MGGSRLVWKTLLSVPRGTILRLEPMQWHSPQTQVPHIGARGVATMNWVAPPSLGAATPRYTFTCRSTVGHVYTECYTEIAFL